MPATQVLLMRHAEKPDPFRGIRGVDARGHEDPAELSVAGWQRAGALPRLFSPAQPAEMLPRPDMILAAATSADSARPVRTVQLLARSFGLEIREVETDDVDGLISAIQHARGVVLVCWRHETIAAIARRLVDAETRVPEWDSARFDMVWVLTSERGGWNLRQRPQLLLPGDLREPIR